MSFRCFRNMLGVFLYDVKVVVLWWFVLELMSFFGLFYFELYGFLGCGKVDLMIVR